MKWMQAPSREGSPTAEALSKVQLPSDWYTQALVQGIQDMAIFLSLWDRL